MFVRRATALSLAIILTAFLPLPASAQAVTPAAPPVVVAPAATSALPPGTPPGGQLSLDDAIALAVQHNPSIGIAQQEVTANRGQVEQAVSQALPHVTATIGRTTPVNGSAFSGSGSRWASTFTLTQPLYTWGALGKGIRAARELLSSAQSNTARTTDTVAFLTRQSYYQVLAAQESVRVQQDVLAAAQEHLRIANLRFQAGVAPQFDVLAAQARVARVEQTLASASGGLNTSWAALSQVLGLEVPPNTVLNTPRPLVATEVPLPALIADATENRADIQSARAVVAVREAQLAIARTGNLPQLGLTASYTYQPSTEIGGLVISQNGGAIVLGATWNLFTAGQVHGEIVTAQARAEQARLDVRRLQLQAEDDVKNAYFGLETAQAQVTAAQQEVVEAQEAYRIAQVRYQEGVGTSVEVLDAQTNLGDARNRLNDAIFALNLAIAQLGLAVGGGTPPGATTPALSAPGAVTAPGVVAPATPGATGTPTTPAGTPGTTTPGVVTPGTTPGPVTPGGATSGAGAG